MVLKIHRLWALQSQVYVIRAYSCLNKLQSYLSFTLFHIVFVIRTFPKRIFNRVIWNMHKKNIVFLYFLEQNIIMEIKIFHPVILVRGNLNSYPLFINDLLFIFFI